MHWTSINENSPTFIAAFDTRGRAKVSVAICILAKDERRAIGMCLAQLAKQTVVNAGAEPIDIHVVANGCTDDTAGVARASSALFDSQRVKLHLHNLRQGGKSRSWNRAVHELVGSADIFVFLDADIQLADENVIAEMVASLRFSPHLAACSGHPVKDVHSKPTKTMIDRFSLIVSGRTRQSGAINGSLYVARSDVLRQIWLPDETPVEDGFLNAMLQTRGFSQPRDPTIVNSLTRPTHSYQAHNPLQFVTHERRLIVGTMINIWIFEHLWSLRLQSPAGPMIRDWNATDPGWVERIIRQRAARRPWLIPNAILFGRFNTGSGQVWWKRIAYWPVATGATLLTLPPAILANRRLKQFGAAATW